MHIFHFSLKIKSHLFTRQKSRLLAITGATRRKLHRPNELSPIIHGWTENFKQQKYCSTKGCWDYHDRSMGITRKFQRKWNQKEELEPERCSWNVLDIEWGKWAWRIRHSHEHIDGKRDIGKHRVTFLTSLCKWMVEEELGRRLRGTNIAKWYNG